MPFRPHIVQRNAGAAKKRLLTTDEQRQGYSEIRSRVRDTRLRRSRVTYSDIAMREREMRKRRNAKRQSWRNEKKKCKEKLQEKMKSNGTEVQKKSQSPRWTTKKTQVHPKRQAKYGDIFAASRRICNANFRYISEAGRVRVGRLG